MVNETIINSSYNGMDMPSSWTSITNLYNSGQAIYKSDCRKWCIDQQFIRDFGGVIFLEIALILIFVKYIFLVVIAINKDNPNSKISKISPRILNLILFGLELLADVLIILFAGWMLLKWKYQVF